MKSTTILLLVIFCCFSCGKDDDGPDNPYGLPNATKVGANTFGCLINGEPWVAEDNRLLGKDINATYDEIGVGVSDNSYFTISSKYFPESSFPPPDSAISDIFSIRVTPIYSEGEVDFSSLTRKEAVYKSGFLNIPGTLNIYELDTLYSDNYINVSNLDLENNIISGEFTFRLIRPNNSLDVILITDGRFDVVYQPN
ncbi:MAG: hypothetical protein ACI9RM_002925 [Ulvibacter sp.]|jgi:hypothetical protein